MTPPPPFLTRPWNGNRLTLVTLMAILAPLTASIVAHGPAGLAALALALVLAALWHLAFAKLRKRPPEWGGIVTAMIFVTLVPATVPLWQQGVALSFGLVMGDLIFGGRGRGFLSPAAVSLAFLLFSFPVDAAHTTDTASALAALAGGALLGIAGILSWRLVIGFCVAVAACASQWPVPMIWPAWPSATLILGLVFLIGDPVAAACTNAGRWLYGFLAGGLLVLLAYAGGDILSSVVFAVLLAAIFAPLIDQGVIWANIRRRARRLRHV